MHVDRQPSQQDISWFLDLNRNNRLDLDPPYQRRSVWSPKEKRFLLDTIFRNYPCPPIFLHKTLDGNGIPTYHVVDGKQRLTTIIDFTENKISMDKDFGDVGLDGKKWKDLDTSVKRIFWNYSLPVEFLNTVEGTVVNQVFERFNRNSRKLERQELRHAKYDGWFIKVAEEEAEKPEWKDFGIVTTARSKRMSDVQFISELLLVILERKIVGFDQNYLDQRYAEYDDPQELYPDFSKEDFYEDLERAKKYATAVQESNQAITTYATSFANFYTLWGIISLNHDKLSVQDFSRRYPEFMEKVNQLSGHENPSELLSGEDAQEYKKPFEYAQNIRGASTDLSGRQKRHEALLSFLVPVSA